MTDESYQNRLLERLASMEATITLMNTRLIAVETKSAVDEVHRQNVEKRLGAIEGLLSRLLWVILAGMLTAVVSWLLTGGLIRVLPI